MRRATPCSRVAPNVCESQMDSRGLRRCRINIKSRRCETLPMKFRASATMGLKKQSPMPVRRLSPAQLAPFNKSASPSRSSPRTVGKLKPSQLAPFQKKMKQD